LAGAFVIFSTEGDGFEPERTLAVQTDSKLKFYFRHRFEKNIEWGFGKTEDEFIRLPEIHLC
jgi:hypothetical protein